MTKAEELVVMKAVALCFKSHLKPEEAELYCNLKHTQLTKKLRECGILKSTTGYYKREDLDRMMAGETIEVKFRRKF